MKKKSLLLNATIYTQSNGLIADSMAINDGSIVAIGDDLHNIDEFRKWRRYDMKRKAIVPGFVDAHTHFVFYAMTLGRVRLQNLPSLDACLEEIEKFSRRLKRTDWVVGEGYAPDRFQQRVEPDRYMLDKATRGRPAFIYSKDQHSAWVNSRALEMAGITKRTKNPVGGEIVRLPDGTPCGILREGPAIGIVYEHIPAPSKSELDRRYRQALDLAYARGVIGVHSFDGPDAFTYLADRATKETVGLRINYYPQAAYLKQLRSTGTRYGTGTDFFRIAGIKIFADGSLGSQTALCFNKYKGTPGKYGIEVHTVGEIRKMARSAAELGLPCAIHAIGDKAVANVLDALEKVPPLPPTARHRIEHLQLIRRKDLARLKRLNVVASMQPSHCPSDVDMINKYWGARGRNAFVFRTLLDKGVDLAFGSDTPIEPLDPIAGIHAAVNRAFPSKRSQFYLQQRINADEALFAFTVGSAIASGQADCRGYLLPGYPADFVVLSEDITKVPRTRIHEVEVLATVLDGEVKYSKMRMLPRK